MRPPALRSDRLCRRSCICVGTGRDGGPNEWQWPLFSWAGFVAEESVKPRAGRRKPQPATLSMFEWAVSKEQEREE